MVLSVKHTFTSPKADGTDSTLIQPSNWNAEHTITLAAGKILGRDSSGSGAVQELPLSFDPTQQSMIPPTGTTAQRPATAAAGMLRYNTDLAKVELYNGTSWGSVGGGAAISDTGPANPQPGDLWWKSDEGQLYVYYNDGTSSQWVIANAFMGGTAFGDITVTSINDGPLAGNRNRIINGDMRIDQRNNGSAVVGPNGYVIDRWASYYTGSGRLTCQRSTVAATGFQNSFLAPASTAVTPSATDVYVLQQVIEGLNVGDLAWGTASAKTVTISFWVRSSVAGLYAARFTNSASNRSYVFTYTISAANTWEYKTITVPGDTTGTWLTDNTVGMIVQWDLGSGSNLNTASPNTWIAASATRTSGTVNFISNNGATFYLTGVQLEVGSRATPFERRNFQQELAMCQRYYYEQNIDIQTPAAASLLQRYNFPVTMRTSPTIANKVAGNFFNISVINDAGNTSSQGFYFQVSGSTANAYITGRVNTVSAEL
jgi:hypothetical protein